MPITSISPIVHAATLALAEGRRTRIERVALNAAEPSAGHGSHVLSIEILDEAEANAIEAVVGKVGEQDANTIDQPGKHAAPEIDMASSFLAMNVECTGDDGDFILALNFREALLEWLEARHGQTWTPRTAAYVLTCCARVYVDPMTHESMSYEKRGQLGHGFTGAVFKRRGSGSV